MPKQPQPKESSTAGAGPPSRSVIISAVAITGIVVFLVGTVVTTIGFFTASHADTSFAGKAAGLSVTTSNAGLALCFFGCVFVGLAAALKPVAAVMFYEQDQRNWIERAPPWIAPLCGLAAAACLVALVLNR